MSKSKPYEIGGSKYAFDFVNGKMVGIQKADDDGETSITKARNEEIKELLKAKLKMKSSGKVLLSPLPAKGKSEKDEEIVEKEDKLQDVKTEEEIPVVKVEEKIADS